MKALMNFMKNAYRKGLKLIQEAKMKSWKNY